MGAYQDDEFVYVDTEKRIVVGKVAWSKDGTPIPLERGNEETDDEGGKAGREKRSSRKRFYPWGSYKTMKRIFSLEGKTRDTPASNTIDDVLEKALSAPYWD